MAPDRTITEHDDGFALSFVPVQTIAEIDGAVCEPVDIADEFDRLVLRPSSVLEGPLSIDDVGSAFIVRRTSHRRSAGRA